jgi:hypothetical protein
VRITVKKMRVIRCFDDDRIEPDGHLFLVNEYMEFKAANSGSLDDDQLVLFGMSILFFQIAYVDGAGYRISLTSRR